MITIPKYFSESNLNKDVVHKMGGNTVVLLNRQNETERSRINLTQHLIAFGIEGKKYFHSLSDDTILYRNEAIFLKKGLFLTTEKVLESNNYKSILFFVDDNLLLNFFNKNGKYFLHPSSNEDLPNYFKFENTPNLSAYINSLLPYFENRNVLNEPLFKVKFEELLLNFILNDRQHFFKKFLVNLNKKNSYNLREFMFQNYTRNLRIEDFAYLNGMSLSSFKRNFEKTFDLTPAKWLKGKRLEKAEFLLQTSDHNVGEIALEVGYENLSHFIRVFKSHFNITPKKYQEKFT
ncbi:helix-turn-helix transcriptional regulator [Kordia sp. YSTF-M3]|uniref:Helix-turn-helix transcriptional regulator n=1 Tax=Kordia aestuariivivens TaxID=2759037 RepID=A0ABR7QBL2_9FLAO|nr:AraC family transcriptional regulator [Kordia aestuariivivens]MBC8755956.1 helix-turn-helix transcriptional regulator [Kordia aestuariivivens]